MAFRAFKKAGRRFGHGRRRQRRWEIAQISIPRSGLALGLSSTDVPDQFFHCIVNYRDWMTSAVRVSTGGVPDTVNVEEPHSGKSITVSGIQFDYQYSYVPEIGGEGNAAVGVTAFRSALCVLQLGITNDDNSVPVPALPPANILWHTETLRFNNVVGPSILPIEDIARIRTLWRGMDMMGQQIVDPGTPGDIIGFTTPRLQTQSRHVRVRSKCRLGPHEGLFFVSEIVNPFLEDNPTVGLDLLGSVCVKTNFGGPARYTLITS